MALRHTRSTRIELVAAVHLSQVIPAENLVALAQPAAGSVVLLAAAGSAGEGRLMLEALEGGTAGVLLRTQDPGEVGDG